MIRLYVYDNYHTQVDYRAEKDVCDFIALRVVLKVVTDQKYLFGTTLIRHFLEKFVRFLPVTATYIYIRMKLPMGPFCLHIHICHDYFTLA